MRPAFGLDGLSTVSFDIENDVVPRQGRPDLDAAYTSTISALAGTVIDGLSTFASSRMTQT